MRSSVLVPGLAAGLLLLVFAACDSTDDPDACTVYETCAEDTPLSLSLIERSTRPPANVTILFKVDTHGETPVANLTPESFDIFENGVRVSRFEADLTILPKTGKFQYSIALLMDLSGSILASENLGPLKEAARRFVESVMVPAGDPRYGEIEMSLWWFDGQADIDSLVTFTVNPETLNAGIDALTDDLPADNSTNLYGAVVQGITNAEQRVEDLQALETISAGSIVIFTDGTDQANRVSRSDALRAVRNADDGLSVYTIGLGGETDEETLQAIGADGFVSAADLDDLVPTFQALAELVRDEASSYYLLEYCSPKRNGDNELGIRASDGQDAGVLTTRFSADDFTSGCQVSE